MTSNDVILRLVEMLMAEKEKNILLQQIQTKQDEETNKD